MTHLQQYASVKFYILFLHKDKLYGVKCRHPKLKGMWNLTATGTAGECCLYSCTSKASSRNYL
ncbi:unnamed protein product [Ixodes pacificus]